MNINEEWVKQFEALTGRKPTAAEFAKGKESNFDLNQLAEMLGANSANPAAQAQPEENQVAGAVTPSTDYRSSWRFTTVSSRPSF